MKIFVKGEVLGSFETSYINKETEKEVITKKVQFMEINENGKVIIHEVKLDENQSIKEMVKGVKVVIPVKLFTPNNKSDIYMSQNGEIQIQK